MKKTVFLLFAIIFFFSCEKYDNTCNCKDPIEDLPWLKEVKTSFTNCICRLSIIQATYNDQTVFYSIMNDPLCDGYYPVFLRDCDGDTIKVYEPPLLEAFSNEVIYRKTIYTCKSGE